MAGFKGKKKETYEDGRVEVNKYEPLLCVVAFTVDNNNLIRKDFINKTMFLKTSHCEAACFSAQSFACSSVSKEIIFFPCFTFSIAVSSRSRLAGELQRYSVSSCSCFISVKITETAKYYKRLRNGKVSDKETMRDEMKMQELLQGKQGYTSLTLNNRNQRPFVNIGIEHFNRAQHDSADPVISKSACSHLNNTWFFTVCDGKNISKVKVAGKNRKIIRFGVCHNFGIMSIRGADK